MGVWYTGRRIFRKYSSHTSVTILCTMPICTIKLSFTSSVHSIGKSLIRPCDTLTNASLGQVGLEKGREPTTSG